MATEVMLKQWGNSIGVVLPKELVEQEGLKKDEKIFIEIVKKANLENIFGALKRKMSAQEFKDMVRNGWN